MPAGCRLRSCREAQRRRLEAFFLRDRIKMFQVDGAAVIGVGETVADGQNHELVVELIRGVALELPETEQGVAAVGFGGEEGICIVFAVEIEQSAGFVDTIQALYIFRIDESAVRTQRFLVRGFDVEVENTFFGRIAERIGNEPGAFQFHVVLLGKGGHVGVVNGIVLFFPCAVEREVVGRAFAGGERGYHAGEGARGEEHFRKNLFHKAILSTQR